MLFSFWLQNGKRSAPARRRTPTSFHPRLVALEERWVPSTVTVTNTNDSGAGSLRSAIAAAHSGDVILFSSTLSSATATKSGRGKTTPPPTTIPTITLTSGELLLNKNLTIQGPGAGRLTISGGNYSRVFEVGQGSTVSLSGLTVSKGHSASGGGILNHGVLTISGDAVSGNLAQSGGGIYSDGTLTITGCTFTGNMAPSGGGIYNSGGMVTFSNSSLTGSSATYGGGIYNAGGTLTVSNNSRLSGNYVSPDYSGHGGYGGGIYNQAGTVMISNSILTGNAAYLFGLGTGGGGIFNDASGTVTIKNSSSITGNTSGLGEDISNEDVRNLGALYRDSTSTISILDGNPTILI